MKYYITGWPAKSSTAKLEDLAKLSPSPHWSFDPQADRENKRTQRWNRHIGEKCRELLELLESVRG